MIQPLILSGILAAPLGVACAARGADGGSGAGMRMYRDPATGSIGAPPPGAPAFAVPEQRELSNSTTGLSEEPVAAPAGGVKVNLRGRFQAAVRRDVGIGNGAVHHCVEQPETAHE